MAKRIPALTSPKLLLWARETAGFTVEEVASRLRKSPELIESWEDPDSDERPFMGQLRKLASIYKRPLSDFYLPEPPAERPIPHDFRRSPGEVALIYTPALRRQLRLARERQDLAAALYQELQEVFPSIDERITEDADPEDVGNLIRRVLKVDFAEQRRWGEGRPAYKAWRRRIEALGVLVFQFENVDPGEAWGFSLVENKLPVIGINRKLAPNGRTFTMLHEFVHILLGEGGICDIDDETPRGSAEMQIEIFCNRTAAAAFMPASIFRQQDVVREHPTNVIEWNDEEIRVLSRTFGVSRIAATRRLVTLGLTTPEFYGVKHRQYLREQEARRRRELEATREGELRRNMPREALSNLGARFVSVVLQNYNEDRITLLDASQYLGVRAEKVRSVEELALNG